MPRDKYVHINRSARAVHTTVWRTVAGARIEQFRIQLLDQILFWESIPARHAQRDIQWRCRRLQIIRTR